MSQITISAICSIIRLLLTVLSKGVRLVYVIMDFVDDGIVNQSAEKPSWYDTLAAAINSLEDIIAHFSGVEDELNGVR